MYADRCQADGLQLHQFVFQFVLRHLLLEDAGAQTAEFETTKIINYTGIGHRLDEHDGLRATLLRLYKKMAREGGIDAPARAESQCAGEFIYDGQCDEQLDNIKATTGNDTRRANTLFSAFPGAPLMAFVNNMFQMRTDGYKYLCTYRRIQPYGGKISGPTSRFRADELHGRHVVVSVDYLSYQCHPKVLARAGAAAGPSMLDEASIGLRLHGLLRLLRLRGFGHSAADRQRALGVELQIESDFLNSKIIDHVADEADAVVLAGATHCDIAVHQKIRWRVPTFDGAFDKAGTTDGDDGESGLGPAVVPPPERGAGWRRAW